MKIDTARANVDPAYLRSQRLSETILDRLLAKLEIDSNGCWIFKAFCHDGYGLIARGGVWWGLSEKACRVAYVLFRGPIPPDMEILHRCPNGANKACCNPDHLHCDTHAANMADERGEKWHATHPHSSFPRGEANNKTTLTAVQVAEIRSKYTGKRGQQSALAREYHVRQGTIWNIVNHVTWKDGGQIH